MWCLLHISIIIIIVVNAIFSTTNETDKLILLHVLHRHGQRTPGTLYTYPNDPYANYSYKPYGHGQLTLAGKRKGYEIGLELRKNYGDFLGDVYVTGTVKAYTTNFKRTKMTLEVLLASLFPPTKSNQIYANLNWQPLPFEYKTLDDFLFCPHCLNWIASHYEYLLTNESDVLSSRYQPLYKKLTKYTGKYIGNIRDAFSIWNILYAQYEYGLKLPDWTTGIFPNQLDQIAFPFYHTCTATQKLRRLGAGKLLKKIIEDTHDKITNKIENERKIHIYSAHDINIGQMLALLNLLANHQIPFGAYVIFEVRRMNNKHGFKIYYQNYTGCTPHLLQLPGCETFCLIDDFVRLVQDDLPTENDVCMTLEEG